MDKNLIKEAVKEMIVQGELKFELERGEKEFKSPKGKYIKRAPTVVLKVKDEYNETLSVSATLLKDIFWNIND